MISVVIPVFNEEKNVASLFEELKEVSTKIPQSFEFIFIDDGSTDLSLAKLKEIKKKDKRVKIIEFTKNFGQTAAFDAGFKKAAGDIVVTIDADLQNDPVDIPLLLKQLNKNFDVAIGWRKKRQDTFSKRFFSTLANFLRKKLTGETIHDAGCSLRAYRREVLKEIDLYGEMHRFIPSILYLMGYKIAEVSVNHRPRKYGKTKYGLSRLFKGLFDLTLVVFLLRFSSRPLHVFGTIGGGTFILGFIMGSYLSFIKFFFGATLSNRPLLILSVLLMVLGVQFFIFGILAEIMIRIYFKTHHIRPYTIKIGHR